MASRSSSDELVPFQDQKINILLSSVGASELLTYLRQFIRDGPQAKEREKAILILGMVEYKTRPPKTINYDALYEHVPLLKRFVRQCQLQQSEDAKTPATRNAAIDDESAIEEGGGKADDWEVVDSIPIAREDRVVPADGGKAWFESSKFRPRLKSSGSSSINPFIEDPAEWDDIDLSSPSKNYWFNSSGYPRGLGQIDPSDPAPASAEGSEIASLARDLVEGTVEMAAPTPVPDAPKIISNPPQHTENETKLGVKEEQTAGENKGKGSWLGAGANIVKSVIKAVPFQAPVEPAITTCPAELEKQFQDLLKTLNAITNLEDRLKEVIGGFAEVKKREDALLILGIFNFLYGNTTDPLESKVPEANDCALLYTYIGMMQKYIANYFHSGSMKRL